MPGQSAITGRRGLDWIAMSVYLSLLVIGWLMLYATVHDIQNTEQFFDFNSVIGKQSIWIALSLFVFICALILDWKIWFTFAYPIYFATIVMLIAVLVFGTEIKGARSWFSLFGMSFQPAEFAKMGTCLALASYLSFYKSDLRRWSSVVVCFSMIAAPMALIILQPDAGSAAIFISFLILLYRRGLSPFFMVALLMMGAVFILSFVAGPKWVALGLFLLSMLIMSFQLPKRTHWLFATAFMAISAIWAFLSGFVTESLIITAVSSAIYGAMAWYQRKSQMVLSLGIGVLFFIGFSYLTDYVFESVLKTHQQDRINAWLRPEQCDPRGSLYNIIQSKLAIGSGGIDGKGFLQGSLTKLNYVPEQTTDFIFSTVGEEQGFIGAVGVIALFTILLFRITIMAERAKTKFISNYAYGVAGLLFIHFFINIGMTMGVMPVMGIPLPFLSKGGTCLLAFSLMLGILLKMDLSRYRN